MKKVKISKSAISGDGIFAHENIKTGEFIDYIKGPIKHVNTISEGVSLDNPDWVGFKKNYWIDPLPPFKYINHSCDPNCGIRGTKTVVAMKNIKEGEELTMDYAITECDTLWNFKIQTGSFCKCGSKKCRKVIRSIQFLPKNIFEKYLPYIPSSFQKLYRATHNLK